MPVVALGSAEYLLVQLALPGVPISDIGILLYEPTAGRVHLRLRRDLALLGGDDYQDLLEDLEDDLRAKETELGGPAFLEWAESTWSNFLRISGRERVSLGLRPHDTLRRLYDKFVAPPVREFITHLPRYSLRAAAGKFGERREVEPEGWEEIPPGVPIRPDMFVAQVVGRSMEPRIPDGSLCVFRKFGAGSREGKLVLVENYGAPGEQRYTIKRYHSVKRMSDDGDWEHEKIVLKPLNPDFEAWELAPGDIKVLGEFVAVIE